MRREVHGLQVPCYVTWDPNALLETFEVALPHAHLHQATRCIETTKTPGLNSIRCVETAGALHRLLSVPLVCFRLVEGVHPRMLFRTGPDTTTAVHFARTIPAHAPFAFESEELDWIDGMAPSDALHRRAEALRQRVALRVAFLSRPFPMLPDDMRAAVADQIFLCPPNKRGP